MTELIFNLPQYLLATARHPEKYLEGGRGVGKSTSVAWEMKEVVTAMPRSKNFIVGETYQQILTRTLPSTIAGLERLGIYQNVHYFVGKKAPKKLGWLEPIQPQLDYKNAIHFCTGAIYVLVSMDRSDSGRGLNTDSGIADEVQLLDIEKLNVNVLATMRGSDRRFKDSHKFMNTLMVGTTPLLQRGKWLYKKNQEALENPNQVLYIRAASEENRANLGDKWFDLMRRTMPEYLYKAEILNIRPANILDGFYPSLREDHFYTNFDYGYYDGFNLNMKIDAVNSKGDRDCNPHEPLEISVDWGASINCMVVCQETDGEHRFLNALHVKSPQILDHLITEQFLPYYEHHQKKEILFYYDRNGNSKMANSQLTYAEQAMELLRKAGWYVTPMIRGLDPHHQDKYMLWNILLQENNSNAPVIRFNKVNAKNLLISMQNAPAKDVKGIQKDKSSERSKSLPQEEATHLSDAADIIVFAKYSFLLDNHGYTHIPVMVM